jgi:hypothetical protein
MPLKPKHASEIDLKDLGNIKLIQYKRKLKIHLMNHYKRLGLANKTIFGLYKPEQKKDAYACIQWILEIAKN